MKKLITAIGNPLINESLKKTGRYLILIPDIQYEEDLLELLKNKKDIDVLILNIEIIKKEKVFDYIKKIKKLNEYMKIIILIEKEDENINNFLLANGIKDIFYGNEIIISKLEESINKNKTTEEILTEEINNLKEIVLNKKNKKLKLKKIKKLTFPYIKKYFSLIKRGKKY